MRSKSIFKRAVIALLIALFLVVVTVVAIAIGGGESSGHMSLICGSGLDRIEVVDKDGNTVWKLPQSEIGWVEVNDAEMIPNGNIVFACRAESSSTVYMIRPDYKNKSGYEVLWTYDVPEGGENHTSQVLPDGGVLIGEAYASYVRIVELDVQGMIPLSLAVFGIVIYVKRKNL